MHLFIFWPGKKDYRSLLSRRIPSLPNRDDIIMKNDSVQLRPTPHQSQLLLKNISSSPSCRCSRLMAASIYLRRTAASVITDTKSMHIWKLMRLFISLLSLLARPSFCQRSVLMPRNGLRKMLMLDRVFVNSIYLLTPLHFLITVTVCTAGLTSRWTHFTWKCFKNWPLYAFSTFLTDLNEPLTNPNL